MRDSLIGLLSSVFFFKHKTAYELRISDWSTDVCSSDLHGYCHQNQRAAHRRRAGLAQMRRRAIAANRLAAAQCAKAANHHRPHSSEERRVGKEWVSTCRSRWLA